MALLTGPSDKGASFPGTTVPRWLSALLATQIASRADREEVIRATRATIRGKDRGATVVHLNPYRLLLSARGPLERTYAPSLLTRGRGWTSRTIRTIRVRSRPSTRHKRNRAVILSSEDFSTAHSNNERRRDAT